MPLFSPHKKQIHDRDSNSFLNQRRLQLGLAASAVVLSLLVACASTPPDRIALNTLKSLRATAEASVAVVKKGRAAVPPVFTPAQEAQARDYYSKYLAADKAAAEAIFAGTNLSTANVAQAVADLAQFVNTLTAKKGP
jgi:hypothetical protein